MGTINEPGTYDCLKSLDPDEPYFLLRSKDASASSLVRRWAVKRSDAIRRGEKPDTDMPKVEEALLCADAMDAWRIRKRMPVDMRHQTVPLKGDT